MRLRALPPQHTRLASLQGPILLSVERLAAEKNLEVFLRLDVPVTKVVVGDGPLLSALQHKYPGALFMGKPSGEKLASAYRAADVFVFPSLPVPAGASGNDLAVAIRPALMLPREAATRYGASYDGNRCTDKFIAGLDHTCGRGGRRRVISHV